MSEGRRGPGKSPWRARVWREQGSMGAYVDMDPDVRPPEPVAPPPVDLDATRAEPDNVPTGSIAVVLNWVGTHRGRALAALAYEQAQPQPRTTLVAQLERLVS